MPKQISSDDKILSFFTRSPMGMEDLAKACGYSKFGMKRRLQQLVKKKKIRRVYSFKDMRKFVYAKD